MDKSVQLTTTVLNVHLHSHTYKYPSSSRETIVPHSQGYGMSHNTTHLNFYTGSRRCVTASQPFPKLEFVVHDGQHFPLLRNLFEPKSYDTSTFPKWQSGQTFQNGKSAKPTSEMIYCSRGYFDLLIQATNFIAWFSKVAICPFWISKVVFTDFWIYLLSRM